MNGKGEKTMGDTKKENDNIIEFGQAMLHADRRNTTIYLLSIIGEIEGHECLPSTSKTTKAKELGVEINTINLFREKYLF